MMHGSCPHCGNPVAHEVDQHGPRLYCRCCGWQRDLLAPPPETLALLIKIDGRNRIGPNDRAGDIDGIKQRYPNGGRKHDWYGATRKAWTGSAKHILDSGSV